MSGPDSFTAVAGSSLLTLKSEVRKFIKKLKFNLLNNNSENLPPYLKKVIPHASRQFLEWFVGFTDAEGCFFGYF